MGSLCFSKFLVYPSKMVGPLYFPSKMGSSEERALMKFKWFFAGTFWGPHCYSKNSAANRDLNDTFFLESLGGARAGRWKTTYLEKSHHTAGSVASDIAVHCQASIVLEHVTWRSGRGEKRRLQFCNHQYYTTAFGLGGCVSVSLSSEN